MVGEGDDTPNARAGLGMPLVDVEGGTVMSVDGGLLLSEGLAGGPVVGIEMPESGMGGT